MSNSKVRIYELSKELHLENKDILEICDELNIPVKSHSSTITESQAERIKVTAEKHHHQMMAGKTQGSSTPEGGHSASGERKQEILAIHHRKDRPFAGPDVPMASEPRHLSPLVEPPRPPIQPLSHNTPTPEPVEPSPLEPVSDLREDNGASSHQDVAVPQPPIESPITPIETNQLTATLSESELDVPKLLRPPARPSETPIQVQTEQPIQAEKPVQPPKPQTDKPIQSPKRQTEKPVHGQKSAKSPKDKETRGDKQPILSKDKGKKTPETRPSGESKPKGSKEGRKGERPERSERPERTERSERPERKNLELRGKRAGQEPREQGEIKPVSELRRPTPPKPPQKLKSEILATALKAEEGEDLVEEDLIEVEDPLDVLKPKPSLKRPTPARPAKRQNWDDEEEEKEDGKGKVAKLAKAGKSKRLKSFLDEDEDLDGDLDGTVEIPAMVSLSTARPPKPKSMSPATTLSSGVTKPPRVVAKTEITRTKQERRERKEAEPRPDRVLLDRAMTLRELAERLVMPETEIIKNLFSKGIAVNITQTLDFDTIQLVAQEFNVTLETPEERAAAEKTTEMIDEADLEYLHRRPPVVTIMGHVDHGKTTLLDSIRKTKVAQGEAGGITQHIGAYHVDIEHNGQPQQIVFLDTPGHEAFTAMRARGARVTDIAVLVVAADDGVQPQTKEAISHARAAKVPIVVAINKVDKPESNPDRIKQELSDLGLLPEEWGGDTIMVPVSALRGENLDNLLEMILLVAELEELSANPDRLAKGTVIEAHLDRTRGPVATLLVQNGTLRVGDIIVAGSVMGKIRAMIDDRGDKVEDATPSFAVEVLGLNDVPAAGDEFDVFENEREARMISESRSADQRESRLQQAMSSRRVSLTTLSAQAQEGKLKELNLILKADVQGSVEAIAGALEQLPQREVQIRILLAAPGEVTETDVDLAAASGAVVVGFNTTLASGARHAADQEGVDVREYNIIYKLLDDIQAAMEGLLDPEEVESHLGIAEVRAVFPVGRGAVAGCYVQSGKLIRNRPVRVRRGGEVIFEGNLESLKRMKEDAREVNAGYECGIGISKFNDWQEGDSIEVYEMVMKRRTLSAK